jgi:hypothetical protein
MTGYYDSWAGGEVEEWDIVYPHRTMVYMWKDTPQTKEEVLKASHDFTLEAYAM